nr:immunoglobulin heavy chain junction region [Mus musculus]
CARSGGFYDYDVGDFFDYW